MCVASRVTINMLMPHLASTRSVVLDAFTSQPSNDAFLGLVPAFRCGWELCIQPRARV